MCLLFARTEVLKLARSSKTLQSLFIITKVSDLGLAQHPEGIHLHLCDLEVSGSPLVLYFLRLHSLW
jgi:hypothetical protein